MRPNAFNRRSLLKSAGAGLAALIVPRHTNAADSELEISLSGAGAEISPHLYGHFIEHLGGVIYDGIWVGKASKVPNIGGIRRQFVNDMKRIAAPNIRWPGGCFADGYHWRDGLGAAAHRPRTATYWGDRMPPQLKGAEPNTFGTHEFMQLCRLTGASPYLAANVASGSPQEFHDWLAYCNAPAGTVTLTDQRAANGDREPFNVRYWGIGNESWNCGGMLKPAEYSELYRLFTSQMPPYGQPFLIACGPRGHSPDNNVTWTEGFFESLQGVSVKPRINGLALHFYTDFRPTSLSSAESTAAEWSAVIEKGRGLEKAILSNWAAVKKYDPSGRIKFVIDEWGVWYATSPELAPGFNLAQTITLRDAVHTAMHFDIFNRHADKIAMANIAQTINCLQSLFLAHEDQYVRTPVYHVFEMYMTHMSGKSVAVKGVGEELSSSASVKSNELTVTLSNASTDTPQRMRLRLAGGGRPIEVQGRVLTHASMNAANTFKKPEELSPVRLEASVAGDAVGVTLPPKSVASLRIRIA